MDNFNLDELQSEIVSPSQFAKNKSSGGGSSLGMSMTYNENGKRCTFTLGIKKLLDIDTSVCIALIPSSRLVLVGKDFKGGTVYKCSNTASKPIIYNSTLVEGFVNAFGLGELYANGRTSISFHNVEIDEDNNIAVIHIPKASDLT